MVFSNLTDREPGIFGSIRVVKKKKMESNPLTDLHVRQTEFFNKTLHR